MTTIPRELKQHPNWIVWKTEERDGKLTKVPYHPEGWKASTKDPDTWSTFDEADAASIGYDGLGFVFTGTPFAGVDLDHVLDGDELESKAAEVVAVLNSYTEVSPGGDGLHVIVKGKLPEGRNRKGNVEMYDDGRYFTVSGNHWSGTPTTIEERQAQLAMVHRAVFSSNGTGPDHSQRPTGPLDMSDRELIEKARAADNGDKFQALWNGDISAYPSASEADLALCSLLAFWTQADPARIDRLFRQGGLMREKWNRDDYRERTISKALQGADVYDPGRKSPPSPPEKLQSQPETAEIPEHKFLLQAGANDEGNAQCVKRLHGDKFLYCEAYGWLAWAGTHWSRDHAEERLNRVTVNTLKRRRSLAVHAEEEAVVKAAKPSAYKVRGCKYLFKSLQLAEIGSFDKSPDQLNAKNGVLDLRTGELQPHDPSQRFTYCLPIEYDPQADASGWLAFLSDVLNSDLEMIDYLQEAVGYSLTGHTFEECLFYLYGPTRAGKGVFTETIMTLLGKKPLATEVDFTTFTSRRYGDTQNFDLAPLKPCRFVAASESSKYKELNTATIKRITGGNEIYCAFKHQDHFSYRPQFKVWLSSNHPVKADPDDDAAWYRVHVIRFPNSYAGNEDKYLKAKLRKPAAMRGLLNWAVAGAIAWYGRGIEGLQRPAQVERDTEEARHRLDYVQQWLDECVTWADDPETFVPNGMLYEDYKTWCDDVGRKPKGIASLTQALRDKGYRAGEQKWYQGTNRRGCYGIELTAEKLV